MISQAKNDSFIIKRFDLEMLQLLLFFDVISKFTI